MRRFVHSLTKRLLTDNISFLAGGVAFYGLLALFPAMAAVVALTALAVNPTIVQDQLQSVQFLFPSDVYHLLHDQILLLVSQSGSAISVTLVVSVTLAIYSATRGTKAFLAALNRVFRVVENRPWWQRQGISIAITFGALAFILLALFLIVALPLVAAYLPDALQQRSATPLIWLRWVILGGSIFSGILLLFSFGPSVPLAQQKLRHVMIGAMVASVCWLVTIIVGSWVMSQLPQLHAAYGSISAVIVLMLWMLMSAYCLLLGAAVVSVLDEHEAKPELPELE